jgi:hypothetical protein
VTADEYLREVGFSLSDLPWGVRRDLLAELRTHLDELPPDSDLRAQLGPPELYANDLRSAAGLERRRGVVAFLRARRPRNLVLLVLALALIALAIGAVAWIDSYQPLAFGNVYQFPPGAKGAPGIEGESVVFRKGRPFALAMEVVNDGRFTVRVLGAPHASYLPWTAQLKMAIIHPTGRYVGPYSRFHSFDLKPGQRRYLIFTGVFACHAGFTRGGALTLSDFPVRFSFLWRKATTAIPLPEDLAIVFPKGCPTPAKYRR